MRFLLAALFYLLAFVSNGQAQQVRQTGTITPGHVAIWNTNGVIQDGGTAGSGLITSLGILNNGGKGLCLNSAPITAPYNQLCMSVATTGAAQISLQNFGGAAAQSLQFVINGTTYTVPFGGGGGGGVSSVGLSMPSVFTVTNSPITTAGVIAVTTNGTSGGIPYFSSATDMASSGVLTLNCPVLGGGAGASPFCGTPSGNTAVIATVSGVLVSGNCLKSVGGNIVDQGTTCGGGSGTPAGSSGTYQYNNAGAFGGVSGVTTDGTNVVIASGKLVLSGSGSGTTVLNSGAAAGSSVLTLPIATDTLVGKGTTDTFTNKTYDTANTGNSFSINGVAVTANQGSGAVVRAVSAALTTPALGVATATSINGLIITTSAGTLTVANSSSASLVTAGAFALTLTATATTNSTLPAGTHTLAGLDVAQTWTGVQSFNTGDFKLNGSTGALTVNCAATCGTSTLTLPGGTTDFSATGGTSQVVKQVTTGAAFTVARLACADLSDAAATCSSAAGGSLVVGTTTIASGTTTRVLYDNAGVLGEMTTTGTGTQLMLAASPTTTGTLTANAANFSAAVAITSNNLNAFDVGRLGITTPAFQVDASTANSITGIKIKSAATAGGVTLSAIGEASVSININAIGGGGVTLNGSGGGTGVINLGRQTFVNVSSTTNPGYAGIDNLSGIDLGTTTTINLVTNSVNRAQINNTGLIVFYPSSLQGSTAVDVTATIASAATPAWNDFLVTGSTTTFSGSTNITGFISKSTFVGPVITASASAIAITSAATVYISGAPTTSASGGFTPTIANTFSLYINSGASVFAGQLFQSGSRTIASAANVALTDFGVLATTTIFSGSTNITGDIAKSAFFAPVLTASASAITITTAATLYVTGPPTTSSSGGFTPIITNPFALIVKTGVVNLQDTTAAASLTVGALVIAGGVSAGSAFIGGIVTGNLASSGPITSNGASAAGVGYATGAGGAVTQTGSRTNTVILNRYSGDITLVSAAGSATAASFTVTNSTVAATDTVTVNQKSGTDLYEIFVTAVAAGSFRITFFTTGGTTTETPVFHFNVMKGVNAELDINRFKPANDNQPPLRKVA